MWIAPRPSVRRRGVYTRFGLTGAGVYVVYFDLDPCAQSADDAYSGVLYSSTQNTGTIADIRRLLAETNIQTEKSGVFRYFGSRSTSFPVESYWYASSLFPRGLPLHANLFYLPFSLSPPLSPFSLPVVVSLHRSFVSRARKADEGFRVRRVLPSCFPRPPFWRNNGHRRPEGYSEPAGQAGEAYLSPPIEKLFC